VKKIIGLVFLFVTTLFWFGFTTKMDPNVYVVAGVQLDSLARLSDQVGLEPKNYQSTFLDSLKQGKLLTSDSLRVKKMVQKICIRFFKDLRYGEHKPYLRYQGFKFDVQESAFEKRIVKHIEQKSLPKIFTQILDTDSKQVKKLVQIQRDSLQYSDQQKKWIANAIHEFRWLSQVQKNYDLVLINIPATTLKYYEKGQLVLGMKTVVGRPKKPSKTLSSRIKNMILFPEWNVPRSISLEELVPEIQKNIRYFYASHLEIFTNKGVKVQAESVPWHRLNANYFPYEMVQRTGYWNTLGLLKFQFDNPFKMYLHDTSEKKLFAKEKRFYSHSCIRLEKPLALGKLLLNGNSIGLDTLNPKTKQVDVKPIYLNVKRTVPIIIWYSTVDFTEEGDFRFYEDVYKRL
jgi:hypothetical protein